MKHIFLLAGSLFLLTSGYSQTAELFVKWGLAKYNLGDYKGAIAEFTRAIELEPDNGEAYSRRGRAKVDMGDTANGCADLKRAADLGFTKALEAYRKHCE